MNWQEFREELVIRLEGLEMGDTLQSEGELHDWLDRLMHSITDAVHVKVPKTKPSPYTKCWLLQELTDSRLEVRSLRDKCKRGGQMHHTRYTTHTRRRETYMGK